MAMFIGDRQILFFPAYYAAYLQIENTSSPMYRNMRQPGKFQWYGHNSATYAIVVQNWAIGVKSFNDCWNVMYSRYQILFNPCLLVACPQWLKAVHFET